MWNQSVLEFNVEKDDGIIFWKKNICLGNKDYSFKCH